MPKYIRMTKQKKLILDILRRTNIHPAADWIFEQARKEMPSLSLSTVYRNLSLLKKTGEIQELNYLGIYSCFDGNPKRHYHFLCEKCKRIYDFDFPSQHHLEEEANKCIGMKVTGHCLFFYGLCHKCSV